MGMNITAQDLFGDGGGSGAGDAEGGAGARRLREGRSPLIISNI